MDTAIAQETAQKDVRDLGSNSQSENTAGVNKVNRGNLSSRSRTSAPDRRHGKNDKQTQPTGVKQRCFRCGLTNHSSDNCKYKDSECFRCHKTGHLQSECRNTKSPCQKAERKHVRHADQDSEAEVSEETEDEFFGSIFSLDGVHHTESRNSGISAPAVKVPVRIEMLNFRWKWTPE